MAAEARITQQDIEVAADRESYEDSDEYPTSMHITQHVIEVVYLYNAGLTHVSNVQIGSRAEAGRTYLNAVQVGPRAEAGRTYLNGVRLE